MNYFITGIGTDVGKTIASAILTESLKADYWKPIQSGISEGKDSETVASLISNSATKIHREAYLLKEPLSPHFAAKLEGKVIKTEEINLPLTQNNLIIEGAGGILVPLNQKDYVIDLAKKFNCEIILVISDYLGCINHSLLSIDYLVRNHFRIKALVFNGKFPPEIKGSIIQALPIVNTIDIPKINKLTKSEVKKISDSISVTLFQ